MELGVAGTIAVKQFCSDNRIDIMINEWLENNSDIEIIDIKFNTSATYDQWSTDAFIIYRKEV